MILANIKGLTRTARKMQGRMHVDEWNNSPGICGGIGQRRRCEKEQDRNSAA